jgi:hypothetical protein
MKFPPHLKFYQNSVDMDGLEKITPEKVGTIVWNYGSNYQISSKEAAASVVKELRDRFEASIMINDNKEDMIVQYIKEYRSGTTLELVSQKIINLIEVVVADNSGKLSDAFDEILKKFTPPTSIQPGASIFQTFAIDQIGDVAYTCKDNTWLITDGSFVSDLDYPDLYDFIKNCNWDPTWGARLSITSAAGPTKFKLPTIIGGWIKAKN